MQIDCEDRVVMEAWLKTAQLGRFDGLALRLAALLTVVIVLHLLVGGPGGSATPAGHERSSLLRLDNRGECQVCHPS